jgi:hypothetical protein
LLGAALLLSHGTPDPAWAGLKKSSLQGKPGMLLPTDSQEEPLKKKMLPDCNSEANLTPRRKAAKEFSSAFLRFGVPA